MTRVDARVAGLRPLNQQVRSGPVALLRYHTDPAARRAERYHLRKQGSELM